jgi:putative phosphoesterase
VKIGVISDTHARSIDGVPLTILKAMETVDLIVHAGDFTEKAVLDGLKVIGKIKAVSGNMDSREIKRILPETEVFTVGEKRIGLIHGTGGPIGITERVLNLFADVDVIIFGHSHEPCNRFIRGTLLLNPGQARTSFGLLYVDDRIRAEIIRLPICRG